MTATTLVFLLAAVNGFLLAGLIASGRRRNRAANTYLAALIGLGSLRPISYALGFGGFYDSHRWLTFAPLDPSAAFGPLLFLYVSALTGAPSPRSIWHLAPAIAQFCYYCACFLLPITAKWAWYTGPHLHVVTPLMTGAILVQATVYVALSWRRYRGYRAWLDDRFANNEDWRLGWLGVLIAATGITLAVIAAGCAWHALVSPLNFRERVPVILMMAMLAYLLGLLGWRHRDLDYPPETSASLDVAPTARHDYGALAASWRTRVATAGWWREEGVTASAIAKRLGVSERTLSRGLSEGGGLNFNRFINALRVQGVKRAIEDGSRDDLLSLAFESGFSSKASFNRAFQLEVGMPPSAWRAHRQEAFVHQQQRRPASHERRDREPTKPTGRTRTAL